MVTRMYNPMAQKKLDKILKKYGCDENDVSTPEKKLVLEKSLSQSERKRYRIHCGSVSDEFPEPGKEFILKRGDRKTTVRMEEYGSLKANSRGFDDLGIKKHQRFKVRIYKCQENEVYELEVVDEES